MRTRWWLALIWICFVARAIFYAGAIPIWEGFDEYAHYARVEYLAVEGREPARSTPLPADVADTFSHVPVRNGGMSIDQFWKLTPEDRRRGFTPLISTIYEAQQPPLFYWLMAPVNRLMGALSLESRLMSMRITCVLLASLLVPLGFLIARTVCRSEPQALVATALMAALPVSTFTATHVTNDALAIPLGTLVVLLTLRQKWIPLAVALGAGLLTKAYFLAFLPAVALLLLGRKTRRGALVALAGAIAIGAWWYWLSWTATGSLTGNIVLSDQDRGSTWRLVIAVPWGKAISYAWMTFVWIGNWSFLVVRSWMYRVAGIICFLAVAGVVYLLWKRNIGIAICAAFVGSFACGIAYFGLVAFVTSGFPGAIAWYACCLVGPIAVLMLVGLETIAPPALKKASGPILVIVFSALEFFGTNLLLLPYYAGMISHLPNGGLPAGQLAQLVSGSRMMMEHLTLYKPWWLTSSILLMLWLLYFLATAMLVIVSVYVAFWGDKMTLGRKASNQLLHRTTALG